jgi:hypothetical protein
MLRGLKDFVFPVFIAFGILMSSCQRDYDYFEGNARISASIDTLLFDTVFTSIGSATKLFKIYNDESSPVQIDVTLENKAGSYFRINVDGVKGPEVKNIEILPKDSIYVFAEVTVNPDLPLSVSPFVIEETLIIRQGSQSKKVLLTAWGQNANYISKAGQIGLLSCDRNSLIFEDKKPYVIYGILVIDDCTIVLPAGTRIHVHGGIAYTPERDNVYNDGQIILLSGAKILSNGTFEKPVTIEGDRLEPKYKDVSGQWGGIRLIQSRGNLFKNTIIKNSIVGVVADSASQLSMVSSQIYNTASAAIFAFNSEISGENCLIYGFGSHALQLNYGGKYNFSYCTFVSNNSNRKETLSANNKKCLDLNEDITCTSLVDVKPLILNMTNCIISGGDSDEISFLNHTRDRPENFVFSFTNTVVRVNDLLMTNRWPNFFDNCKDCLNQKENDKLFLKPKDNDFRLDTMSIAREKALPLYSIKTDITGKPRKARPDIGCFEF